MTNYRFNVNKTFNLNTDTINTCSDAIMEVSIAVYIGTCCAVGAAKILENSNPFLKIIGIGSAIIFATIPWIYVASMDFSDIYNQIKKEEKADYIRNEDVVEKSFPEDFVEG